MALNRTLLTTVATKLTTDMEVPLLNFLPRQPIESTTFLIGCGRSGTTIFGECLARHSSITYLHEPREFWAAGFPATDIWSRKAEQRRGRLLLTENDASADGIERLRRLFGFQVWKTGRPVLVEKLPINNFRIGLLAAVAPDARFIHLLRDGREVARSIQRRADDPKNRWYGRNQYKWRQLAELAEARGICKSADMLCTNNYERGLLEWRLSMEVFQETSHAASNLLEVSYNNLVELPVETLENVLEFMDLDSCPIMLRFVHQQLKRRTARIDTREVTDKERAICGEHLLHVVQRLEHLSQCQSDETKRYAPIADAVGAVSDDRGASSLLHSLQTPARVTLSPSSTETTDFNAATSSNVVARAVSQHESSDDELSTDAADAKRDGESSTDRIEATVPPRRRPGLLRRMAMGVGVLYAFGPHLGIIKLLGPRLGIRWARLTAHAHWVLTWFGVHHQTRDALRRLRPKFDTKFSVSKMLHEHLLLKHQSFAEWRLAVTPAGKKYIAEVYQLPPALEDTIREHRDAQSGVLFVVYHFGMYKVLASAMAERYDTDIYKANYLSAHYRESTLGPIAQWAFRNAVRTNQASGTKDIYLRPDSAPIALVKRLKRGKLVGIAADGMISDEFVNVSFLGGSMRLPSGWAKLAAATQSAVVVMFVDLVSAHERKITAYDPFFVEDTVAGVDEAVQTCASKLEHHVAQTPWQWHIWHRVEFNEDDSGHCQMSSQPMVVDTRDFHYEQAPK